MGPTFKADCLILDAPTLVIEVLSHSTEAGDRGKKFTSYRSIASLREHVPVKLRRQRTGSDGSRRYIAAAEHGVLHLHTTDRGLRLDAVFDGIECLWDAVGTSNSDGGTGTPVIALTD